MRPLAFGLALAGCSAGTLDLPEVPEVTITGKVATGLCTFGAGVTVEVLDGVSSTVTAADGTFTLRVPATSTLRTSAPEHVPMLTSRRVHEAAHAEIASFPLVLSQVFHGFARYDLDLREGTVIVAAVSHGFVPIAGVTFTLRDASGEAAGVRRYVNADADTFAFVEDGGTGRMGAAAFFRVAPGRYSLEADRPDVASLDVEVLAGHVTFDVARIDDPTAVVRVHGSVDGFALYPLVDVRTVLPETQVTLEIAGREPMTALTDIAGAFSIDLPVIRAIASLRVDKEGWRPMIFDRWCLTTVDSTAPWDILMGDPYWWRHFELRQLGREPAVPGAAHIRATAFSDDGGRRAALSGITVEIDPPLRTPFYGDVPPYRGCSVSTCEPGCPTGTRCENGECVRGDAGPLCSRAAVCPVGFHAQGHYSHASDAIESYCMPMPADCHAAPYDCPADSWCAPQHEVIVNAQGEREFRHTWNACLFYGELLEATGIHGDGSPMPADFDNLPPGRYTVRAHHPDGRLRTRTVDTAAGAVSFATFVF